MTKILVFILRLKVDAKLTTVNEIMRNVFERQANNLPPDFQLQTRPSEPGPVNGQRIYLPFTDCSLTIHWSRNNMEKFGYVWIPTLIVSLPCSAKGKYYVLVNVVLASIDRRTDHFCCFAPRPEIAFSFAVCNKNSMLTNCGVSRFLIHSLRIS